MNTKSFWGLIGKSSSRGIAVTTIIATVGLWPFKPESPVKLVVALPILCVCIFLIVTLMNAVYLSTNLRHELLPKVLASVCLQRKWDIWAP